VSEPIETSGFVERVIATATHEPLAPAIDWLDAPADLRARASYGELLALAEQYRSALLTLEMQSGEILLVALPAGPDFVAALCAAASLGIVFAPLGTHATDHERRLIVEDLQPHGVVTRAETAAPLLAAGCRPRFVLLADSTSPRVAANPATRTIGLDDFGGRRRPLEPPAGNPVVTCHYTYKGLGYPVGVLHRYRDYSWATAAFVRCFGRPEGASNLVGLPAHSIYGLTALLAPLFAAGRLVILSSMFGVDVTQILAAHRIQFACVVPLVLARMAAARPDAAVTLHPDLRLVSGGSYMSAELAARVRATLGVESYQGYGLTETLPVACNSPQKNRVGSIGTAMLDELEVAIIDSDGRQVPAESAGRIAFRGPTMTTGFLRRPELLGQFTRGGWFDTGDLGFKDRDGFLHYLGRSYALTKIASQMVDLRELELLLERHPGVVRARVTSHLRPHVGETLRASVIADADKAPSDLDLRRWCLATLSPYKTPREFRILTRDARTLP